MVRNGHKVVKWVLTHCQTRDNGYFITRIIFQVLSLAAEPAHAATVFLAWTT
jgi:hypothetical protein